MCLKHLVLAAAASLCVTAARADETVRWLHLEQNPAQVAIWNGVAEAFDAARPGVQVDPQFLENEAFKAKLTTMLQSRDEPSMFYSWAGGVLRTQVEAGVLEDLTDTLNPTALEPFRVDGRL